MNVGDIVCVKNDFLSITLNSFLTKNVRRAGEIGIIVFVCEENEPKEDSFDAPQKAYNIMFNQEIEIYVDSENIQKL